MNGFFAKVLARLADGLGADDLEWLLRYLIAAAEGAVPGGTEAEKKDWVKATGRVLVENFDNKIPVLGAFADLPPVDFVEAWAWNIAVDWVWGNVVAEHKAAQAAGTAGDTPAATLAKALRDRQERDLPK